MSDSHSVSCWVWDIRDGILLSRAALGRASCAAIRGIGNVPRSGRAPFRAGVRAASPHQPRRRSPFTDIEIIDVRDGRNAVCLTFMEVVAGLFGTLASSSSSRRL